jgi:tetratricopeptide (TPR) repeat protein
MLQRLLRALFPSRTVEETPSELWTVATAHDAQNNPVIVRCRSTTPEGVRLQEYPHLMTIAWKYESETGMPAPAEKERMNLLERGLVDQVEPTKQAFLMVVVTGKGVCEWRFYSKDDAEFMALLNRAFAGQPKYPIDVTHQSDPKWAEYRHFRPPKRLPTLDAEPKQASAVATGQTAEMPAANELLNRAKELRQRGMSAQAADLVVPLTRSDDLSIKIQSLLELVSNQCLLKKHQEVLTSLDRLEGSLSELLSRKGPEASQDERTQNFFQEMRLIRHARAAEAYEGLGKIDVAIDHARAAIAVARGRRKPGDAERVAHREYALAVILRPAGRVEEALAVLDAALVESPGHIPSLILKAVYLELLGRKDEGEALFATIHPQDETALAYFTLNAPSYHALRGEKDRMLQLLEKATHYWGGPHVVAYALEERDFTPYREDPDFRACLERCRLLERRA